MTAEIPDSVESVIFAGPLGVPVQVWFKRCVVCGVLAVTQSFLRPARCACGVKYDWGKSDAAPDSDNLS